MKFRTYFWTLLIYFVITLYGKWAFPVQLDRIEFYAVIAMLYAIWIKEHLEK